MSELDLSLFINGEELDFETYESNVDAANYDVVERYTGVDATPNSELRELVGKLERNGERLNENEYHTEYIRGGANAMLWMADELERVIEGE